MGEGKLRVTGMLSSPSSISRLPTECGQAVTERTVGERVGGGRVAPSPTPALMRSLLGLLARLLAPRPAPVPVPVRRG